MRTITGLLVVMSAAAMAAPAPEGAVQKPVERQVWEPGPASMPPGTERMVLEGNPSQPGLFTMRLKVRAGSRIAPHTHPRHERVTVLSGAVAVGFGATASPADLTVFRAGSYYANPPGAPHSLSIVEDSVVQITAEGPWEVNYVK